MHLQIADGLRREHAAAQEAWLEGRLALGEHRELLPILESMLRADPWHERRLAMRMTALAVAVVRLRAGRRGTDATVSRSATSAT
jgi:hypothetical protein